MDYNLVDNTTSKTTYGKRKCSKLGILLIADNAAVVDALKEGHKEAQKLLRLLNMALSSVAQNKRWFLEP